MAKAITMRPNAAKTAVHPDYNSAFSAGQSLATQRSNPMQANSKQSPNTGASE